MQNFYREIVELVRLATPVSLAQLSLVGMSATDVLIAGQAGTVELAGMNLGVNTWNMVIFFFLGIGFSTQPLIAKRFGAQDHAGIKHQFHQSMWVCFALGTFAMILVCGIAWVFQFLSFEQDMLRIAQNYLYVVSLCAIPITLVPALRGTFEGMSLTRVVFLVNFVVFLLNIPFDYVLVHGLFGFPKFGAVGCAWATVILMWFSVVVFLSIMRFHKITRALGLTKQFEKPHRKTVGETLKLGLPIGFSIVVELSMFAGAGMLIALFGPVETAAHAVAITLASMSFMIYMGLAQGVTIRASQFLGAEKPEAAWVTVKVGTGFNLLIAALLSVFFILFAGPLVKLFISDTEVMQVAVVLLYFGAAFQVADCLQVAVIHALRAYHDTRSPPKYQVVAFLLIGMPIGYGLAFLGWWPGLEGAKGMWFAMVLSLFLVGILLTWRLLQRRRAEIGLKPNQQ